MALPPRHAGWVEDPIRVVMIVFRKGNPHAVVIDGQRTKLTPGHVNFRLLVAAAMYASAHGGDIDSETLGKDRTVWGDGKTRSASDVNRALSTLKNRLRMGEALTINASGVHLNAEVVTTNE